MSKGFEICRFMPLLAVALLACGCSGDRADQAGEEARMVRFGTTRVDTRGVTGNAELQAAGSAFSVWGTCRKSGSSTIPVFDGTRVTCDGNGQWSYDEPQYWFPTFTYDFRALHPADLPADASVAFAEEEARLSVSGFDAAAGIDLLAAVPASVTCVPDRTMGPVNLEFRHLLARVAFVGRSDEQHLGTGRRIVIDRAVLYGMRTRGDWAEEPFTDLKPGTWTPTGEPVAAADSRYTAAALELATDGTNLFPGDDRMFFIPQELTDEVVLEITYHYNYSDAAQPLQFTGRVALGSVSERWEAGKSYRYPFTISDRIFFETPTVEEWQYAPINGSDFNVDL
ncbi:MAG: fimbrillin family protein [Alistipes sp.]|nr:fimbrillin family protein [Alistipes sp.]